MRLHLLLALASACGSTQRAPERAAALPEFTHDGLRLRIDPMRDDLVRFELSKFDARVPPPILALPMTPRASWKRTATGLETSELRVEVSPTLCVTVTDLARGFVLHRMCPDGAANKVTITRETTTNVYGLGEQFVTPGATDGDWIGRERAPGNQDGNAMVKFDTNGTGEGAVGNAQFPILYALSPGKRGYALFVDDPYPEHWSFTADPWQLATSGDALRWYVIAGPDLPDLRRDYMELVGHAPVPPRQAFGLWISEYGFDDWRELDDKLATLRTHHFPVDGFVLDLQWFGNIVQGSETSRMGTLSWDTTHFPDPAGKIKQLRDEQGVALMVIEESYVARGLPEHADLAQRGYLVREREGGPPLFLSENPWWGVGGMIDWSNTAAADYWHDTKRQPLVDIGVLGHWCDLGEPEIYSPTAWYLNDVTAGGGHRDRDVHDLYALMWVESLARGYGRHRVQRRPFVMARSGAPGIQRFGASMWSGDIGSNLTSLAAHLNVQMHMSLSGIDYFGADIGGFHREPLRGNLDETYTQWFADGMAIDVPGRVHTENVKNTRETAPDRIGHMASNLASVRRRYELVPYTYSVAHHAWRTGDPVVPPLVWAFQDDPQARTLGGEKLLGDALLVALAARDGAKTLDVYLPAGATWVGFDDGARSDGGKWLRGVPLYDATGVLHLPLYARAGAIVPLAIVDDQTRNTFSRLDTLRLRVFAGGTSEFTLVEDDGETTRYETSRYLHDGVRDTVIHQTTDLAHRTLTVTIDAAEGTYDGALARRALQLEAMLPPGATPSKVTVDGAAVQAQATAGQVRVVAPAADVTQARTILISW
jgi:alpha-glucosidase